MFYRKRFQITVLLSGFFLFFCGVSLLAAPPKSHMCNRPVSMNIDYTEFIDINRILMFVANDGVLGCDLGNVFGNDYGTYFPYGGDTSRISSGAQVNSPLYSSGLWIGGKVNGETRISATEYFSDFWPGPMEGGTYDPDGNADPAYRVYKLYCDSTYSNPNQDYLDWPVEQGAPVNGQGYPFMEGDQMLWCVYNDANPNSHQNDAGRTAPLGIEVRQTVYGLDRLGNEGNVLFINFEILNKGGNVIDSMYIGFFVDPDLGGSGDDLIGCTPEENLFFCYNSTNNDQYYRTTPPALGFRLIAGPLVPSVGDTATYYHRRVPNYRNMDLSVLRVYVNGTDPHNVDQSYNMLKGLNDDGSVYFDNEGHETKLMYNSDPVTSTGNLDPVADDKRLIASCGPITMNPGDSQYVLICMAVGQGTNRLTSITAMRGIFNQIEGYPTDVADQPEQNLPATFTLSQNYPNPFNPSTHISYAIAEKTHVRLEVFNILGRRIATLVDKEQSAGDYHEVWTGTDAQGDPVASGIYFYRLTAGQQTATRKMILLK